MQEIKSNQSSDRRRFIANTGIGMASLAVAPNLTLAGGKTNSHKIRIGIVGGRFGAGFQFHEHPGCIVEAVSDLRQDRRENLMKVYGCSKSFESLEKLILDPKIDAVFIATPAPDHVRHVVMTLKAGKNVLCAVPAAMTIEECYFLRDTVRSTGLTYMMAETSYFRQNTISVRKFYNEGLFGEMFSAAAG